MVLTQPDIEEIEKIVKAIIGEEIKNLPTRDEFYKRTDEMMGELRTIRQEQKLNTGKLSDHEDRISDMEEETPGTTHSAT